MAKKKPILVEPTTTAVVVDSSSRTVTVEHLILDNSEIYTFFAEKEDPAKWMEKAITIGTIGLKQMTIAENVDFVEKEFHKFLSDARAAFKSQQETIGQNLDINNPESVLSKFKMFMMENQEEFTETVEGTFSIDNKKSQFARFQSYLDKSLDMHQKDSPLNQFKKLIDDYFDEKKGKIRTVMQSYFDDRTGHMKILLDKSFDIKNKDSNFSKLLDEIRNNTDLEEETIKGLLDPNKTDSPVQLLKNSLLKEFEDLKERELKSLANYIKEIREKDLKDIRDHLLQEEAAEEQYLLSTSKGFDFETDIYVELTALSKPYEDNVTRTGKKTGPGGKIGDIIIDIDGQENNRIVVECKDDTSYRGSTPKTIREAQEALTNRKGKYCIFIFKEQDLMPPQLRPIKITDEYLITSAEGAHLQIAYRLARLMLQKKSSNEGGIDAEALQQEINGITATIGTIAQIQTKVTTIKNACTGVDSGLDALYQDIEQRIRRIRFIIQECKPNKSAK